MAGCEYFGGSGRESVFVWLFFASLKVYVPKTISLLLQNSVLYKMWPTSFTKIFKPFFFLLLLHILKAIVKNIPECLFSNILWVLKNVSCFLAVWWTYLLVLVVEFGICTLTILMGKTWPKFRERRGTGFWQRPWHQEGKMKRVSN